MHIAIQSIDHLVLTVTDIEKTCHFYCHVLGMKRETFGDGRTALKFGTQKINLHLAGSEIDPFARHPTPGSADICLIAETDIVKVLAGLEKHGLKVESGIVERTGACGKIYSVYVRDPDGNLVEISNYA